METVPQKASIHKTFSLYSYENLPSVSVRSSSCPDETIRLGVSHVFLAHPVYTYFPFSKNYLFLKLCIGYKISHLYAARVKILFRV
jgi:hypothetical protein